jgi:hypothetical protein
MRESSLTYRHDCENREEVSVLKGSSKENWRSLLLAKQHGKSAGGCCCCFINKSRGWRGSGGTIKLN